MQRRIIKSVLVGFMTALSMGQWMTVTLSQSLPQSSPQNISATGESLEKQIFEIIDARYDEIRKSGGFVENVPIHLDRSDMQKIRESYGPDVRRFHRDIVSILSDPKNVVFWHVMFMVLRLDIRNEAVLTKMCEIAQHEPFLPFQDYAVDYLFRLRHPQYVPVIVKMMRSNDPYVRQSAYNCIGVFGDDVPQEVLDLLIEDINREYDHGPYISRIAVTVGTIVKNTCDVLAELGPAASPALPALERLLQKEEDHLPCAYAICRIAPDHQKAFEVLAKNLAGNESVLTRKECAEYLGNLAPSTLPVERELMRSYRQDVSKDVRLESLRALIRYLVPQGKGQPLLQQLLDLDAKKDGSLAKYVFEGCYEYQSEKESEESDDPLYDTIYEYNDIKVLEVALDEFWCLEHTDSAEFFVEEILFRDLDDPERYSGLFFPTPVSVFQKIVSPDQLAEALVKYRSRQK